MIAAKVGEYAYVECDVCGYRVDFLPFLDLEMVEREAWALGWRPYQTWNGAPVGGPAHAAWRCPLPQVERADCV